MTMPFSTTTSAGAAKSGPGWRGIARWIGRCADALAAHCERRAAIKILAERDDRELRDIGLTRSSIEAAVGGASNPRMGTLDDFDWRREPRPRMPRRDDPSAY